MFFPIFLSPRAIRARHTVDTLCLLGEGMSSVAHASLGCGAAEQEMISRLHSVGPKGLWEFLFCAEFNSCFSVGVCGLPSLPFPHCPLMELAIPGSFRVLRPCCTCPTRHKTLRLQPSLQLCGLRQLQASVSSFGNGRIIIGLSITGKTEHQVWV